MAAKVYQNKAIGESVYTKTLSCGIKCYIIPKCGFGEKQAYVAVKYGANDCSFLGKNGMMNVPEGVAHFIEHKLFEEERGNVFPEFSKGGADVNAFTDCNKTAYYFSCKNNFYKNFGKLLDFVQSPYFTEESVEREKSIIGQEITMFDDDMNWRVYYQMLQGMYQYHPVRNPIAGSVDSIQKITKDILYQCYEAFYVPENMAIVVVGELDVDQVLETAQKHMRLKPGNRAKTTYQTEQNKVQEQYVESVMDVGTPLFQIGWKQQPTDQDGHPRMIYGMKLLLDIIAGEGSKAYEKLYDKELVTEAMGLQYLCGEGFSFSTIGGNAKEPEAALSIIEQEIKRLRREGIAEEDFCRIQKKHLGRFIRGFNSISAIALAQLDAALRKTVLLDGYEAIKTIKKGQLEQMLAEGFTEESRTLSVVHGIK